MGMVDTVKRILGLSARTKGMAYREGVPIWCSIAHGEDRVQAEVVIPNWFEDQYIAWCDDHAREQINACTRCGATEGPNFSALLLIAVESDGLCGYLCIGCLRHRAQYAGSFTVQDDERGWLLVQ